MGDETLPCLDFDGSYMTMHLSELREWYNRKGQFYCL